ncbi:MAG: UDP-2,3-diacylglucosamine diphosphatase LpxI [Opitutales bacterium]|jgi:UDP-2,3-diacylglucosamine hydrolase|nr:UDP-2,3-diacylglucosamine diphosphatase LpxI [Opitutales bacterium]MDP4644288.1 UDP-2,3-diacylglucosamine diphosphatase LpxI [Opitutales bacterium]MDP4776990.1 UDP-2,3-diacylglucosamine diphosphatase LpxI [Opitutales bacterium]MDP4879849.1 UDP-2,3-diacylglucosamine diphosphatase LpxI [Opitutales bacterium]MDP4883059.1 UDP-2,3-diacylglucosamine diphosphatase LpxI [Opitutales bacterium]
MSSPPSVYLPNNFAPQPIGLIAGKGRYPILMAERILAAGLPLRVISFAGETDTDWVAQLPKAEHIQIKVGQLGKMLKSLQKLGCQYAVMAGQITPRRLFHGLHPDIKALKILNSLTVKNAETIFGAIASEIEAIDIQMLDARSFLDDELAHEGLMTPGELKAEMTYIEHGIKIAKGAADLDIGQGAVVRKGTVLAVEAYEGTDPMLQRAGSFKTDGLIFVKTVKRRQDYRFDVPVFGDRTLDVMHAAGIRTAALEAGNVLILDKATILAKAKKLKIELYGYSHM